MMKLTVKIYTVFTLSDFGSDFHLFVSEQEQQDYLLDFVRQNYEPSDEDYKQLGLDEDDEFTNAHLLQLYEGDLGTCVTENKDFWDEVHWDEQELEFPLS